MPCHTSDNYILGVCSSKREMGSTEKEKRERQEGLRERERRIDNDRKVSYFSLTLIYFCTEFHIQALNQ